MPAKKKLNGELLTSEEMQSPMGLGYVAAAERLGLIYLYDLKVIAQLLVDYANDAYEFSMSANLPAGKFWPALDKKADELAIILKGQNPAYRQRLGSPTRIKWRHTCHTGWERESWITPPIPLARQTRCAVVAGISWHFF